MARNLDHRVALLESQVEALLKADYIPLNENLRIRAEQAKQFAHFQRHIADLSSRINDLRVEHSALLQSFENHLMKAHHRQDVFQGTDYPVLARLMDELPPDDRTKVYMYASALRTLAERGQD